MHEWPPRPARGRRRRGHHRRPSPGRWLDVVVAALLVGALLATGLAIALSVTYR